MEIAEIALSFIIGLTVVILVATLFSLKTKGIIRLAVNSLVGAAALIVLSLFKVVVMPVNTLSALIVGILGVPGLIAVYMIAVFL